MLTVRSRVTACSTMTTASAPRGIMPPVAIAIALPASDREERDRLVRIAREHLGGYFERMYDEGRQMPMDEVAQIANAAAGLQTAEYQVPILADTTSVTPPVAINTDTLRVLALGPLQVFVGDEPIDERDSLRSAAIRPDQYLGVCTDWKHEGL